MDLKEIKNLIELFESLKLSELEVEEKGVRIKLKKPGGIIPVYPTAVNTGVISPLPVISGENNREQAGPKKIEVPENTYIIKSPMVGTFYRSSSPDSAPYTKEGDQIEKGQVVCIVEAMKLMNEIESEVKGKITVLLKENGQPVEFGEPLFYVEPIA